MWTLEPIQITDDTDAGESTTDVVFPMRLFDDTAGGLWGVSGSSWLHMEATGRLITRFDETLLDSPWVLTGADAVTPTRIATGAVWSDGNLFGDIVLFDTVTKERTVVLHQDRPVGNLAVSGDSIVFISYASSSRSSSFDVSRLDLTTGMTETVITLEGAGAMADVDVGSDGRIYVASDVAKVIVDAGGTVLDIVRGQTANPQVAVNHSGDAVWIGGAQTTATPFEIQGGSEHARTVIEQDTACDDAHLSLDREGMQSDMAALCDAAGVAWLGEQWVVVSVGSEDGAPLVRVTPPSAL